MGRGEDLDRSASSARPGPGTTPDFWSLLKTLREYEVDFVIIGGFAVTLHGYVRATKDIDIVPNPTKENLTGLWKALEALDASPAEIGEFDPDELPPFSLAGLVEGQGNWTLYTKLGRLDLMLYVEDADGEIPYADLRATADEERFDETGGVLYFASAERLIAMKEHAGRDEDLRDVGALRRSLGIEEDPPS